MTEISTTESTDSTTTDPRRILATRLAEAGLSEDRFAPVESGTKTCYQHDLRVPPADLHGNYAVSGGDGLVILDIDVSPDSQPEWLRDLPPTFEVETPHGGRQQYYAVASEDGISNTAEDGDWGSVRFDRLYAIGPGSTLDHEAACNEDKEGCPGTGTGEYTVIADRPIVSLAAGNLDTLRNICGESSSQRTSTDANRTPQSSTLWEDLTPAIRRRLERAEEFKFGDQLVALKNGDYDTAGFKQDRSRAEFRLVEILGWLFDDDQEKVHRVMTAICHLNPQTNAGARKWLERPRGYRDVVVGGACQHDSTYIPRSRTPLSERPEVSHITSSKVLDAMLDLGLASTAEIAQHEVVDRSKRQVQRAIEKYEDEEFVQFIRSGRRTLYYFSEEFVPPALREKHGI